MNTQPHIHADLLIAGARVLTMDPAQPTAETVAITGNTIVAVGSAAEVAAWRGPNTRVVDGGGRTLTPGIVESHLHIFMGSAELDLLELGAAHGRAELTAAVRSWSAAHPGTDLLYGKGVSYAVLDDKVLPTRHDLDAVLPDRPFAMMTYDHHTVFANSAALKLAGILGGAPVPVGSEIVMGADGLATGELREPGAFRAILALTATGGRDAAGFTDAAEPDPPATPGQRATDRAVLKRGLDHCASLGITSLHNMDGNFYMLELLQELDDLGALSCRCNSPFHFKNMFSLDRLADAVRMREQFRSEKVSSGRVKLFMDGVLESWTALTLAPYPDHPTLADHHGDPNFSSEEFAAFAVAADRLGLQITVHAVGDGAVRRTLDGYAAARAANGARDSRHRIEHLELIDTADVPRLRELGVVASLQPTHAPGPVFPDEPATSRIGPGRADRAYAWQTIAGSGAAVAINSDWPVAPLNPMVTLHAAVSRPDSQALSLVECLSGQTAGGAYAEFMEHRKGRLAPGMLADVVLWSADLEATPEPALPSVTAVLTVCDGRITFAAGGV